MHRGRKMRKAMPCTQPNIIVILADDLSYWDISHCGQREFSTPNIDRMAHAAGPPHRAFRYLRRSELQEEPGSRATTID